VVKGKKEAPKSRPAPAAAEAPPAAPKRRGRPPKNRAEDPKAKLRAELINLAEDLDFNSEGNEVGHVLDELVTSSKMQEARELLENGSIKQIDYLLSVNKGDETMSALKELKSSMASSKKPEPEEDDEDDDDDYDDDEDDEPEYDDDSDLDDDDD